MFQCRKHRLFLLAILFVLLVKIPTLVSAQSAPDLSGLWDGVGNTTDLVQAMKAQGKDIPFTLYGADRLKKVDMAQNPNGYCLPPGPSRAITGPSPFHIVQHKDAVAILFENHFIYRLIYTDGAKHPEEVQEYTTYMGHSIGRWQGDTLVVDTVGINDKTWLDSNGMEHSDKLHLTERFQKTGPDSIKYSVTYEDPVFFTKPWTFDLNLQRVKDTRILEYVCEENEKDLKRLRPTSRTDR